MENPNLTKEYIEELKIGNMINFLNMSLELSRDEYMVISNAIKKHVLTSAKEILSKDAEHEQNGTKRM